jgi:predicted Rossmann fold flavoprotein
MTSNRIIVVGGGPAGLMAAGQAALSGVNTILMEKMSRPGSKLGMTGKGRCNLTNNASLNEFISHYGPNGRFMRQVFNRFFSSELIDFLKTINVHTVAERGGRIFPLGNDARYVVNALQRWVQECGVEIKNRNPVQRVLIENDRVAGVIHSKGDCMADAVIIATGGLSYPSTGSTGDGFKLAKQAGHCIVPTRPALVPLETKIDIISKICGLRLKNVLAVLLIDGKKRCSNFGEMQFTSFGITGPTILTLSKLAVDAVRARKEVVLSIDLKPALDEQKLDGRLRREFKANGKKALNSILKTLLPKKMIPACIEMTGIDRGKPGHQITAGERKRLREWLKGFQLKITGYRPFSEAIVTAGGVDIKEIDPRNMASKLVKKLYFAGEILDIDGDTGGYNLQAAFSTGWLAGGSAAINLCK